MTIGRIDRMDGTDRIGGSGRPQTGGYFWPIGANPAGVIDLDRLWH
jgi:hypothetical protein